MPKKVVQDIVPQDEGSRSIRNIPVTRTPRRRAADAPIESLDERIPRFERAVPMEARDEKPARPEPENESHERPLRPERVARIERPVERPSERSPRPPVRRKPATSSAPDSRSRYLLWLIVGIAVVVLIFAFSGVFSGAKVTVFPKIEKSEVSARVLAKQQANESELAFQVVTLSKEGSREAEASGEQMVETKASGTIIIFNNNSTSPQPLVARTRFETKDGLIYRILSPVTVPGKRGDTPGSIEVKVVADQAGAEYNIELQDFTIPGFANDTARFKNIYARSKTPMTGGAKGKVRVVKETDVVKMRELIRGELKVDLYNQAKEQVADNSVLYESAVFIDWTSLPNTDSADGKVIIREKADLHAIVFKKADLMRYAASVSMPDASDVRIENVADLQFSLIGVDPRPWEKDTVQFNLKGEGHYVWNSDLGAFELALLGRATKELPQILSNFPGIDRTEVIIRPFWKKTFPQDMAKIHVIESPVDE